MFKQRFLKIFLILTVLLSLSSCGYNKIQVEDEGVKAAWGEVLNQYKSRSDLIPQIVASTKGYMKHEQEIMNNVANARAKLGQVNVNANEIPDEATMKKFQSAQNAVSSSLSRLLAVVENYPQLKADQNFQQLNTVLEGRENRVNVARRNYIEKVKAYNILIRQFPTNITAMIFGYKTKPSLTFENEEEIQKAPEVKF